MDGSIEEQNGNKYLTFASTDNKKRYLKSMQIKSLLNSVEKINDKQGEYEKNYMKIKFNSDDNLPSNKIIKLCNLTVIVRSVFEEDGKYYPHVFLDECLYEL